MFTEKPPCRVFEQPLHDRESLQLGRCEPKSGKLKYTYTFFSGVSEAPGFPVKLYWRMQSILEDSNGPI